MEQIHIAAMIVGAKALEGLHAPDRIIECNGKKLTVREAAIHLRTMATDMQFQRLWDEMHKKNIQEIL